MYDVLPCMGIPTCRKDQQRVFLAYRLHLKSSLTDQGGGGVTVSFTGSTVNENDFEVPDPNAKRLWITLLPGANLDGKGILARIILLGTNEPDTSTTPEGTPPRQIGRASCRERV